MSLSTQSLMIAHKLPGDAAAEHADVCRIVRAAASSLRIRMFGWTDISKADAVGDAHQHGVELRIILDALQAAGKKEKALLDYLTNVRAVPASCVQLRHGLHGAYMHDKVVIKDAGIDVADGQFPDLTSALDFRYPVSVVGSTNWSESAYTEQDNLTIILPGKILASWLADDFDRQWESPL